MSLRNLKSNRTRYKAILEKELKTVNSLLEDDRDSVNLKDFTFKTDTCIKRLSSLCERLEATIEKISLAVAGTEEEDDTQESLSADGALITPVIDTRDYIVTLENSLSIDTILSGNPSTNTVVDERYTRMEIMHLQMQQLMIDHQTLLLQQALRQQNSRVTVKLQQLEIPKISGDKMKWT